MQEIPKWINKIIREEDLTCSKCDVVFEIDNLISIGIQESTQSPHNDTLCIGIYCSKCKELTIFELKEMTLVEFAFEILGQEAEQSGRPAPKMKRKKRKASSILKRADGEARRKKKKSKITRGEIQKDVSFLNSIEYHEEFLIALGFSLEQIDRYNIKK